jgi:hypothetical protein
MKILICGDRNWSDREKIAQQLRIIAKVWWFAGEFTPTIIQGCNGYDEDGRPSFKTGKPTVRGADMIAREEAKKLGFLIEDYPYPGELGRAGGPVRNQLMADQRPDLGIAFHSNIEESKGTKDMVRRARQALVPVEIIT